MRNDNQPQQKNNGVQTCRSLQSVVAAHDRIDVLASKDDHFQIQKRKKNLPPHVLRFFSNRCYFPRQRKCCRRNERKLPTMDDVPPTKTGQVYYRDTRPHHPKFQNRDWRYHKF